MTKRKGSDVTKTKKTKLKGGKTRAVLVTTEHRGVFYGTTSDPADATTVKLTGVRNCLYWCPKTGGFLGLASEGPTTATASGSGCRIGAKAEGPITLQKVTCVADVTPAAAAVWESAPCWGR